jgi:hypothetical protein
MHLAYVAAMVCEQRFGALCHLGFVLHACLLKPMEGAGVRSSTPFCKQQHKDSTDYHG